MPESERTLQRWFDTTAFVAAPAYTFGNSGVGILRGPGYFNWDQTFFKRFKIHEDKSLEFRTEFSNFTNTPAYGNPNWTLGPANFGTISATSKGQRTVQFGLKFLF